jgi:hypothetical protein
MKRAVLLLILGIGIVFSIQSTVSATTDPPHNESSGVSCSDCHGQSLLNYQSPFWTDNTADTVYNSLCTRCHYADNVAPFHAANAPQANTHTPGGAAIKCTDCHHNHDQDQIYLGKNYKSDFFIATATGTGVVYNSGPDTTDITYNPASWSGSGIWADPSMVDEKTDTGRGAQLVPDRNYRRRWDIFMIKSVNTGTNTITVKGNVTTALGSQATSPNIGIFYGQLIRRDINSKTVRLWNNSGANSFVDAVTGNGICQVCHTTTNYYRSDGSLATHNVGADCTTCHNHMSATTGAFEPTGPDHETDGLVSRVAGCSVCHAGDVIAGSNMHESQCALCHQDPGVSNYTLIDPATSTRVTAMPDGGTPAGTDGGGSCIACHGDHDADWYFHEVDHVVKGWVAPNTDTSSNTVNCAGCHTYVGNDQILLTVHDQVTQSGVRATVCQQCHVDADKSLQGSAANHGEQDGGWGDPNECANCHTTYYEGHNHHDSAENDVTYNVAVDTSQSSVTGCAECHNDLTSDNTSLNNWTGIKYEHDVTDGTQDGTGACVNCHDYDGSKSAPQGDVDTAITSGSPATCATCHTDKVPNVDHGGHANNHFGWDSYCSDCHYTTNNYVVQEVHSNTCTICHSGTPNRNSEKLGDAVNGIDGDATQADGTAAGDTWSTPKCTTCHPDATYSMPFIHHDSTKYTVTSECANCHNQTDGHAGNHIITVDLATNCADCHDATKGGTNNVPVGAGDNKLHDDCTSCHVVGGGNIVVLIDPATSPLVTAMPNGGDDGGTNGGGTCEACHTVGFTGFHATVNHGSMVAAYVNCSTCHSATGNTVAPGDPKVHDACSSCHQADGRLSGSATGNNGGDNGGNNGGGNCAVCHNEYFSSHSNINHTVTVADTGNCNTCHTATAGTVTTVPLGAGDGKVHDLCTTCHMVTGALTGAYGTASSMPDGGDAGGTNGGGDCNTCHAAYFSSHTNANHTARVAGLAACTSCHDATAGSATTVPIDNGDDKKHDACADCHNTTNGALLAAYGWASSITAGNCGDCHGAAYFDSHVHGQDGGYVDHTVSFDSAVDRSQNNDIPANACNQCHTNNDDAAGVALDSWTDILGEHVTGCGRCHSYVDGGDGTPPQAANDNAIANNTVSTCITCHTPKDHASGASSVHGGHGSPDTFVTETAACTACHDSQVNRNYITDIHGRTWSSFNPPITSNCQVCHQAVGGGGALQDYSGGGVIMPADTVNYEGVNGGAGGECLDCHNDGGAPLAQLDDYTGETTGQAAGFSTGTWNEVAGTDGTSQWMVWTGATASSSTGPSNGSGGSGEYVVLESSPASGSGGGMVNVLDAWTTVVNGGATVPDTGFTISGGTNRLLVVTVGVRVSAAEANTFTVSYGGQAMTATIRTVNNVGNNSLWMGYLNEAGIAAVTGGSGGGTYNISVTVGGSNVTGTHVKAISLTGVDQGSPITDHQGDYSTSKNHTLGTALTVAAGDRALVSGVKDDNAITAGATAGYTVNPIVNNTNGFSSLTMYRDATTASSESPIISNSGAGADGIIMAASIKAAPAAGDFDATNGDDSFAASSTQTFESNVIDASAYALSFRFDWNMNVNDNADATLHVDAWNGVSWDADVNGGTVNTGSSGDAWTTEGPIDLSGYSNNDFKLRIRYVVGTGTLENNDVAIDNLDISGIAIATSYHPAYAHTITTSANCATTCHTDTGAAIITGTHNVVVNPADCYICHQSATAAVIQAIYDGADGTPQNCNNCHTAYNTDFDAAHTADTHNLLSAPADSTIQSDDCDDCHTQDIIAVDGMHDITDSGGYVSCSRCHTDPDPAGGSDGTLRDVALTNHTVGVASTCLTCHTATYFSDTAQHTSNTHSVAIDGDTAGGQTCSTSGCHDGESENWANIKARHDLSVTNADVCKVCHDTTRETNTIEDGTGGVQKIIIDNARTANIVSCLDCHTDRSVGHGGHQDSHFGWGVSGCEDCHGAGAAAEAVVSNIHGNSCDFCHTGGTYNATTDGIGAAAAAANGADGDANLANGAAIAGTPFDSTVYICTTCHQIAGSVDAASMGGIHHDNKGSTTDCTTACHTVSGHEGNHTNMIADAAGDCTSCHAGVIGGASGAPIDGADGSKHDTCTTCHQFAASPGMNGILVSAPGGSKGVDTMNDATPLVTTDGGGNCVDCHNAPDTWTTMHTGAPGVDHVTSRVQTHANCSGCHGNAVAGSNARDAVTSPFTAVGNVHATGCGVCHTGADDGGLNSGPFTNADILPAGGGTCVTCHTDTSTWTTIHTGANGMDHSTRVDGLGACTTCHTATAGGINGLMPLDATSSRAGDKVHDTCSECHQASGVLQGGNTTYGNQPIAKGDCGTCHTAAYFDSHVHGQDGGYIDHSVSFNSTVDRSQNNDIAANACNQCHTNNDDATGAALSSWTDIIGEHETGCARCHSYTDGGDGTPTQAENDNAITAGRTAATCITCHVKKDHASGASSVHGGHSGNFGSDAACTVCHNASLHGGTDVVADIHSANGCDTCHSGSVYNATTEKLGDAANGVDGDARLANGTAPSGWASVTCLTCHPVATYPQATVHHDHTDVTNGNCQTCHTDPRSTPAGMSHAPYQMSCGRCHVDVTGTTVEVMAIAIADSGSGNGTASGNTRTLAPGHSFTITAGTGPGKIVNYGSCLWCHGTTGWAADRAGVQTAGVAKQTPYHAMTTYGSVNMGGVIADGQSKFRIGAAATSPIGDTAYWGPGRGIFNMKHAEFSIQDHYLQPNSWNENLGGETGTYAAVSGTIPEAYTFFEMYSANLGANAFIPVFDSDYLAGTQCSATCDTVTINTGNGETVYDQAGRGLTIDADTTSSTATLTAIWGGTVVTLTDNGGGNFTGSFDMSGFPTNVRWHASDEDDIWIISDEGGSAQANPR